VGLAEILALLPDSVLGLVREVIPYIPYRNRNRNRIWRRILIQKLGEDPVTQPKIPAKAILIQKLGEDYDLL
jgi:hypothetical protein